MRMDLYLYLYVVQFNCFRFKRVKIILSRAAKLQSCRSHKAQPHNVVYQKRSQIGGKFPSFCLQQYTLLCRVYQRIELWKRCLVQFLNALTKKPYCWLCKSCPQCKHEYLRIKMKKFSNRILASKYISEVNYNK